MESEHHTRLDRITPEREAALARFWERYIEIIHNQGVTEPFDRWYVIRAQAYIDARPGWRLKAHQASDLTDYPNAIREWGWQYVFPSAKLSVDPRSGQTRRHHAHESGF